MKMSIQIEQQSTIGHLNSFLKILLRDIERNSARASRTDNRKARGEK